MSFACKTSLEEVGDVENLPAVDIMLLLNINILNKTWRSFIATFTESCEFVYSYATRPCGYDSATQLMFSVWCGLGDFEKRKIDSTAETLRHQGDSNPHRDAAHVFVYCVYRSS